MKGQKIEIRTEEDVVKWAELTAQSKGEHFTALTKADQFAIARYILKRNPDGAGTSVPDAPEQDNPVVPETQTTEIPRPLQPMTRACVHHQAGLTAQQAYDRFLDWAKEHPQDAMVMDFSNGKKSSAAAFAYWLGELVTVALTERV